MTQHASVQSKIKWLNSLLREQNVQAHSTSRGVADILTLKSNLASLSLLVRFILCCIPACGPNKINLTRKWGSISSSVTCPCKKRARYPKTHNLQFTSTVSVVHQWYANDKGRQHKSYRSVMNQCLTWLLQKSELSTTLEAQNSDRINRIAYQMIKRRHGNREKNKHYEHAEV